MKIFQNLNRLMLVNFGIWGLVMLYLFIMKQLPYPGFDIAGPAILVGGLQLLFLFVASFLCFIEYLGYRGKRPELATAAGNLFATACMLLLIGVPACLSIVL